MSVKSPRFLAVVVSAFALGTLAEAATPGTDNASATAYDSGWTNGSDGSISGGAAFGPWTLTNQGVNSGHFIGNSTSLASPGADINTSGESFGMFGHSGQTSEAFRAFDSDLSIGQTFSIELAVNFRNGNKGFDLRNSSNAVIFNFNIGGDDYVVNNAATGNGSIGSTFSSNTEFLLSMTQTSAGGGTWSITRSGGVSDFDTGTFSGVANNFKLYESNTTGGGAAQDNLFVNNISIVPEPSGVALLGLGLFLTGLLSRRRHAPNC